MIGNRIKERRKALHLTQEELGAKVGVQKSAIAKYEKGVIINLKRSTIAKLAKALECDPVWLMDLNLDVRPDPERPIVLELVKTVAGLPDDDISFLISMAKKMGGAK